MRSRHSIRVVSRMAFFEEELEKRTQGRIDVESYYSGVLGQERELMDMVALNILQATRGGFFADATSKYGLFLLPFLVEDWDQALRLVNSDLAARINRDARKNGFHVPACGISQGFRAHTTSVRPIRHPDDMIGLKNARPLARGKPHHRSSVRGESARNTVYRGLSSGQKPASSTGRTTRRPIYGTRASMRCKST